MADTAITLTDGLKIGGAVHKEVVVREPTVADILAATEAGERLMLTHEGWQLLSSPTRIGVELLCRQVVRIGSHDGPLTRSELELLTPRDYRLIEQAALGIDTAVARSLEQATNRGRDAAPSG